MMISKSDLGALHNCHIFHKDRPTKSTIFNNSPPPLQRVQPHPPQKKILKGESSSLGLLHYDGCLWGRAYTCRLRSSDIYETEKNMVHITSCHII